MSSEAAEVRKVVLIREREGKVHNFELTFNLGKSAQGRFLTDFPQGMAPDELATQIDGLDYQVRRLQAKYDIEMALDEIAKWQADHETAEKNHVKQIAKLKAVVDEQRRIRTDKEQSSRQEHARTNHRGEWKAPPQVRQELSAADRAIENNERQIAELESQRDQALQHLKVNTEAKRSLIDRLRKRYGLEVAE